MRGEGLAQERRAFRGCRRGRVRHIEVHLFAGRTFVRKTFTTIRSGVNLCQHTPKASSTAHKIKSEQVNVQ
ncbi:hypothetical protein Pd630_LPD04720 [Rhodococcus opacus PD630]|nr:hypothetical protein Pd630_LPD04720 [Rhodococcus opacus PD630]